MWANKNNSLGSTLSKNKFQAGFTIVETLIVLSVSAALFISTALLISGQLNKNSARDAAVRLESNITQVLQEVSTSYYPITGTNFGCNVAALNPPSITTAGQSRGKNTDCLLIGKKITFEQKQMKTETLVINANLPTFPTATASFIPVESGAVSLTTTRAYPGGAVRKGATDKVIYVLNTRLALDTLGSESSGAQQVKIFRTDGTNLLTNGTNTVCFDAGVYSPKLEFSNGVDRQVTLTIDPPVCVPS